MVGWGSDGKAEVMKTKKSSGSIRSIFMHADFQDWFLMALGVLGSFGDGFTGPLVLFISSRLMNNIGGASSRMDVTEFVHNSNENAVSLLYLACGSFLSCFLEGYCWTRTGQRQAARMRSRYLKAMLRQEVAYFDLQVTSTSEVITSVSNDSTVIQDFLSEKVPNLLTNLSVFVASYVVAFSMFWRLAIVALPFVVLLVIPGLIYGRTLTGLASKIRDEYNQACAIAEQAISSIRTVYSFAGETKTIAAFSSALQGSVKLGLKQGLAKGLAIGSNSIVFVIWSFICYYGSRLVMYHGAQGGTVFTVGAAMALGGLSLGAGLSNVKYLSEASSAGERIMEVIKRIPKIDSENMGGEILGRIRGEVEFDHVEFAYPSRPDSIILKDFSVKIPAGKTAALVGGSGSGKSTVISLLQRFYDPTGGEIRVDGVGIKRLQLKWMRSQMGLVSQEPALFATSIKENILFGKEDASEEEIVEAAKASNAHDFISQLPLGYDTQVGEQGIQISRGQKQRIAIARAMIKKPQILLLDEATSALDSESERVVQEALNNATVGCTTIIIAHHLFTVQNVDIIAVLQNGSLMEIGSHDELINNNNGLYASLVHLYQIEKSRTTQEDAVILTSSTVLDKDINNTDSRRLSLVAQSSSTNSMGQSQVSSAEEEIDVSVEEMKLHVPSFRRLLALNLPEWKQATLGCFSAFLFGAIYPLFSFTMGSMVSTFFLTDHDEIKKKMKVFALCYLGLMMSSLLISISQHYSFAYMGEYLTKRIRERTFSKILTFEVSWFDQPENTTGAVCSRLVKDANMMRSLIGDRMSLLIQTFSTVIIACTISLVISWRFTIVIVATQPLIVVSYYTRRVLLKSISKKASKAQDECSKLAAEAVSNLRIVTAFSSQDRILKMLEKAQEGPRQESLKQSWFAGIGLAFSQSITACTWALDFWYGGRLMSIGLIKAEALFQTFMVLMGTSRVIADAGSMTSDLVKGADSLGSLFTVLDRYTKIEPNFQNGYKPNKLTGLIELCDIHFSYPTRPNDMIFQGFSMRMEARKSTALVGQSGSGKSTIIGLIERFYDPLKGIVSIDGINIKSYHLRTLREHIALVSQEPTLFAGSIKENIVYGARNEVDEAEMVKAAKVANAHEFISSLKDGYETWCGDRGVQLSGGSKAKGSNSESDNEEP